MATKLYILRNVVIAAGLTAIACWAPACEHTEASVSGSRKAHMIEELEAANELSIGKANSNIGPVEKNDYMIQAYKADRAIKKLRNGYEVSPAELQDALMVPSEPLSAQQKADLIEELQQARKTDVQGISDYALDPVIAQDFEVQEEAVDKVIEDLEIGEPVPRSEILAALEVPANP
jgi:hypothetical protein